MRSLLALALLSSLAAPALAQEGGGAAPASPPPEAPPAPEVVAPEAVPEAVAPAAVAPEAVAPAAAAEASPSVAAQPESVAIDPELFLEPGESELEVSDAPTEEHWYGWQTLATDGASFVLLIAAGATAASGAEAGGALGGLSLTTYLLGGPIVHFAHENVGRGFGSLALRGGLPIVFGAVGVQLEDCSDGDWFCGLSGAVLGGLLGIVTAITVDASLLGYESVPVETTSLPNIGVVVGRQHGLIVTGGTF